MTFIIIVLVCHKDNDRVVRLRRWVRFLVVCQVKIDGYNLVNLIRASSVVNCQSTGEED
jgi:hypothetical protein